MRSQRGGEGGEGCREKFRRAICESDHRARCGHAGFTLLPKQQELPAMYVASVGSLFPRSRRRAGRATGDKRNRKEGENFGAKNTLKCAGRLISSS